MRFSRRALAAAGLVAALALVGIAIALSRADAARAAAVLREVVTMATGRELEIRGPGRIELGLPPNLVFEDLVIAGERADAPLARVSRLEVQVDLLPLLLSREVRVTRIAIAGAEVRGDLPLVRRDRRGSKAVRLPRKIRLHDVRWTRPRGSGEPVTVVAIERALLEATWNGRASVRGRGEVLGRAIDLRGNLGPLDAWNDEGGVIDGDLAGSIGAVGRLDAVARLRRGAAGERPRIEGTIRADHLDWPDAEGATEKPADRDLFPETRLPLGLLGVVDGKIELSTSTLSLGRTRLRDVGGLLLLDGGALRFEEIRARVGGGTVAGRAALDAGRKPPAFSLALTATDVDLSLLLREAGAAGRLRGGIASAEARLDGRGESPAAIAASLEGEIKALMGRAEARTTLFDALVVGPTQVLGRVTGQREAWTTIECAAADFSVRRGIARPDVLLAATPRTTLVGQGEIDFREERIALELAPSTSITDPAIGLPVTVSGPLSRPRARVDELGAAKKLAGLFSVAAFPPAAIASLAELGSETHPCVALAAGRRPKREAAAVRSARETGESIVGGITEGARKLGESVGLFDEP